MTQNEHPVYPRTAEDWLKTPLGASLLEQETRLVEEVIEDVFGEECLQIGQWGEASQFLKHSRTQRSHLVAGAGIDGWEGSEYGRRIDYILMSDGSPFEVTRSRRVFTEGDLGRVSDHVGVYAEFKLSRESEVR